MDEPESSAGKEESRKGYEVAATTFWRTKITNLKGASEEPSLP